MGEFLEDFDALHAQRYGRFMDYLELVKACDEIREKIRARWREEDKWWFGEIGH